jgi:hypothetical protein
MHDVEFGGWYAVSARKIIGSVFFEETIINTWITFRFLPSIIIANHFYYPTNALNYTKLRG